MMDLETRSTVGGGGRPTSEQYGDVGALGNIPLQLGGDGGPGTSPRNFSKKGCKWCILRDFSRLCVHFLFLMNFIAY